MTLTPTPDDKFSFGLWTVGCNGTDPFGGATRAAARRRATPSRSSPSSARTVSPSTTTTCSPFGSTRRRAREADRPLQGARWPTTGLIVPMVTTNLFTAPGLQGRRLHLATTATCAASRCARCCATSTWPPSSAPRRSSCGAAARAPSTTPPRTSAPALERYREAVNLLGDYVIDKGYDIRFAIEPKPNEPRGDILLPTVGHALAFIDSLEHPELVGPQPRGRPRADGRAELRRRHRAGAVPRQALPHRPQRPARHQVRPGPRLRSRRPAQRVRPGRPARERRPRRRPGVRRPAALRLQAARAPRTTTGVWESAAANMRTYLLLKERAAAFRADPEVQEALRGRAGRRARPCRRSTRARRYDDLLADRSRVRGLRRGRTSAARASASCGCSSSPPSTCSAPADRTSPAMAHA